MKLTKKEQKALDFVNDTMKHYGDGYSDVSPADLTNALGLPLNVVKGVIGSLVKKKLVFTDLVEESGEILIYSLQWEDYIWED